jgi:hypothetical protein
MPAAIDSADDLPTAVDKGLKEAFVDWFRRTAAEWHCCDLNNTLVLFNTRPIIV